MMPSHAQVAVDASQRRRVGGVAHIGDLPELEYRVAVGDRQRKGQILLDEKDCDPCARALGAEHTGESLHHGGLQPFGNLVDQDETGRRHQGARDDQHLLLAAAQRPGLLPPALADDWEILADPIDLRRDPAVVAHAEPQILLDGKVLEQGLLLRRVGDAAARDQIGGKSGYVVAEHLDASGADSKQSKRGLEQGRLAHAVLAQEREDLSRSDIEGHVAHDDRPAIAAAHIPDAQRSVGHDDAGQAGARASPA
jgi:hypothetical protein